MSDGDFFSRWSRRKRETDSARTLARSRPEPGGAPEDSAATAGDPARPRAEAPPGGSAGRAKLSAEELAGLPSLDALTPGTDLVQYFREGVPEWLRKAALRRMWAIDPAIRDYAGDARDYAYDWNTPGGVPGFGPLLPADAARLAAASGVLPAERTAGGIDTRHSSPGDERGRQQGADTPALEQPAQELVNADEPLQIAADPRAQESDGSVQPGDVGVAETARLTGAEVSEPNDNRSDTVAPAASRRHGSATPV